MTPRGLARLGSRLSPAIVLSLDPAALALVLEVADITDETDDAAEAWIRIAAAAASLGAPLAVAGAEGLRVALASTRHDDAAHVAARE